MLIYEQIEEMGIDAFLSFSQAHRDKYLRRIPSNELMSLFAYLTSNEMLQCFSIETLHQSFQKLPVIDLLALVQETMDDFPNYQSKATFRFKWSHMEISTVLQEWENMPFVIQWLLDKNYITISELRMILSESSMSQWIKWSSLDKTFAQVLGPLIDHFQTMIPLPQGVREHAMSFLFPTALPTKK